METTKTEIYIAVEETNIFDLYIPFSNGKPVQVRLKKGDTIPTELLNKEDLEKSLRFGGLGRLLKAGIIKKVDSKEEAEKLSTELKKQKRPSEIETQELINRYNNVNSFDQKKMEEKREEGQVQNLQSDSPSQVEAFAVSTNNAGEPTVQQTELNRTEEKKKSAFDEYQPMTDLSKITTVEEFKKLNHFDKLYFVKGTKNIDLLKDITEVIKERQVLNNCKLRIEELEKNTTKA